MIQITFSVEVKGLPVLICVDSLVIYFHSSWTYKKEEVNYNDPELYCGKSGHIFEKHFQQIHFYYFWKGGYVVPCIGWLLAKLQEIY